MNKNKSIPSTVYGEFIADYVRKRKKKYMPDILVDSRILKTKYLIACRHVNE